jgi:MinD-like ATPase involved in chromosome partitioning or flagellar assembly
MPDIVVTTSQWRTTVGQDIKDTHSLQAARETLATAAGQHNLKLTVHTTTIFGGQRKEHIGSTGGRPTDAYLEGRGWLVEARLINKSLRIDDKRELLPACQQIAESENRGVRVSDEFGEYTVTTDGLEVQAAIPSQGWINMDGFDIQVITGQERQELVSHIQNQAQALRTRVKVDLRDGDDHTRLVVSPDGQIEEAPMYETPPQPAYAPTTPPLTQYPDQEQLQNPTAVQPTAFPQPQAQQPVAPVAAEAPIVEAPQPAEPAFEHENDPEWREIAAQPATDGIAGWLNATVKTKLAPKSPEIEKRQDEFRALLNERAEEARRVEEEARRAEEQRQVEAERERRRQERERERVAHNAELDCLIQTNFGSAVTILVANPKGGSRKTTTDYTLGATFGLARGGYTVAWDNNETMGTLGQRAIKDRHSRTVVDLLQEGADYLLSDKARIGALDSYVRQQGSAHFHVLASDEDATKQEQIDAAGYKRVHDILERFYRVIIVDTGNNIRKEHFVAAVESATQLVIPVAAAYDSMNAAKDMMTHLQVTGHGDLVERAVVLIHELEPIYRDDSGEVVSGNGHEITAQEIADEFAGRVAEVLPIPYDSAFKEGREIDYFNLAPATVDAYREAAAAASRSIIARREDESAEAVDA